MKQVSHLGIRTARLDEALLFLLGLFSTWQIIQFAGFSVATLLTLALMFYFVLSRKPAVRKEPVLVLLLIGYTITTVLALFWETSGGYKKTAISNYIQWFGALIICHYATKKNNTDGSGAFLRGFDWSCRVQLAWCVLQALLYKGLNVDLNMTLFGWLMEKPSHIRADGMVPSGLHWHAANMIPILAFTFFRHKNVLVKGLCVVVAYFTKNTTSYICMLLCVGMEILLITKRMLVDQYGRVKRKNAIIGAVIILSALLLGGIAWPKIESMISYILYRFWEALNPTYGNESSATHLSYYTRLPYVLERMPLAQILFGTGMSTSGHYFSQYFLQYSGTVWVVESDVVNTILSCGVVGFVLQYGFLFYTIRWMGKAERQNRQRWVLLILMACGVLYNNQFNWVLQLELMLYARSRYLIRQQKMIQNQ